MNEQRASVECRVVEQGSRRPLGRVEVRRRDATGAGSDCRLTNEDGICTFRADEGCGELALQIVDRTGAVLAERAVVAPSASGTSVEIAIDPRELAKAKLRHQAGGERVLPASIWQPVERAIALAERTGWRGARLPWGKVVDSLPPLFRTEGLVDLAHGVLEGSAEAYRTLGDTLADWELWSVRRAPRLAEVEPIELTQKLLQSAASRRRAASGAVAPRLVPKASLGPVVLAVQRVSGQSPQRTARARLTLDQQLTELGPLHRTVRRAEDALGGTGRELKRFIETLERFVGGINLPDPLGGWPRPGGFPEPWPQPGGFPEPWPGFPVPYPDPSDFHDPFDIPERIDMWDCLSSGGLRAPRPVVYSIHSIEPMPACPGQEIVITGEHLGYEGRAPRVSFPGPGRSRILVDSRMDGDRVRVHVPEGAHCGDLELDVPEARHFVAACGEIDLYLAPSEPFRFEGGTATIERFVSLQDIQHCVAGGSELVVAWSTCATESVELAIQVGTSTNVVRDLSARGTYGFTLPRVTAPTLVQLVLRVSGCGGSQEASLRLMVDGGRAHLPPVVTHDDEFTNWHGNVHRDSIEVIRPRTLEEVVAAVVQAESNGQTIGVRGSAWSYGDCVVADDDDSLPRTGLVLYTDALTGIVERPLPDYLQRFVSEHVLGPFDVQEKELPNVVSRALRDRVASVLTAAQVREFSGGEERPIAERLVHVRAGTKLSHLSWLLHGLTEDGRELDGSPRLAMATLGGSNGQSLAGAISTGTHGANCTLPPISDFVRAIHLVGAGGVQWWIEPATNPVTDPERMQALKHATRDEPKLDPCMRIIYDDELFEAVLVAPGTAGVIYSVVLEAAPLHKLRSTTRVMTWDGENGGRNAIRRLLSGGEPPFFLELVLNAQTRNGRITTREIVDVSTPSGGGHADSEYLRAAALFQFGPLLLGLLPDAFARYVSGLFLQLGTPVGWARADEILEEIRRLTDLLITAIRIIEQLSSRRSPDRELASMVVQLLNLLWRIPVGVISGREVVRMLHDQMIGMMRLEGVSTDFSYRIYNNQTTPEPMTHSAFERLVESYEYVMDASVVEAFVDEIFALADRSAARGPLILTVNVRFTRSSRAMIAMQQFPLTGYVELWTIAGMEGNPDFHQRVEALVASRRFDVRPHWGHLHRRYRRDVNFGERYSRIHEWRAFMNTLAAPGAPQETFRSGFARSRSLW